MVTACKKETLGEQGSPVQEKGAAVAVTVNGFTAERLELEGPQGPLIYADPVLALKVTFENKGEAPFLYKPTHADAKTTNLEAPILFKDPGPEGELRSNIEGVFLQDQFVPGQQSKEVEMKPGEVIEDLYLFKMPEEESLALVLTVPPVLHGGKGVLKIKVAYKKEAVPPVVVSEMGKAVKLGNATVTVDSAQVTYIELMENKKKGFSKEPVFKVSYTIKNDGGEPLNYEPLHQQSGSVLAVALHEDEGSGRYMRVRFSADRDVVGQTARRGTIAAGEKLEDFAIFERPPEGVTAVRLLFPGKLLGQTGLMRVRIPYKNEKPKNPVGQ